MRLFETETCGELRQIKGVAYPRWVRFSQIVITGPSGTGKSTRVRELGGWPEEGCLDLIERCWWRSRVLSLRPREVHLYLPWDFQHLLKLVPCYLINTAKEKRPKIIERLMSLPR